MDAARFQQPRRRTFRIENRWGSGEMTALDFGDPARPPDLLFLHANGFNALTYRSLLAPLAASLRIIAPDLRGHGGATLPADHRARRSWDDHRDDLASLLDALPGPPLTLAGHSMGGTCAILAAAQRPDRVSGLVLIDPVLLSPLEARMMRLPLLGRSAARLPIVQGALRRRADFAGTRQAFEAYRGRGAFRDWPDTVLADYVAGGFKAAPQGVTLACAREWEASNYAAQANDVWGALAGLDQPIRLLYAERGSTCRAGALAALRRRRPDAVIERPPGSTHFMPMLQPDRVRDALFEAAV